MKRRGHQGMNLLVIAGIIQVFGPSRPILTILATGGIWVLEPLPDKDQNVSWLKHRKSSHSILAIAVCAAIVGGLGWVVGQYVVEPAVNGLNSTPVSAGDGGTSWWLARLAALDAPTLSATGMWIGAGAIATHMLGDVVTTGGLQPLLPFSNWKLRFSPLSYDNWVANNGVFGLGVLAVLASLASVAGLL